MNRTSLVSAPRVIAALVVSGFAAHAAAQTINYRSIGTALDDTTGTVTATSGSPIVTGSGTQTWKTLNRGRGDRITISGVDYTILSVDTETQLTLTSNYAGGTGSLKPYTIARKFKGGASAGQALIDWEDCIDGPGGAGCEGVSSASLVADNRREVGIAYKDSVFTLPANVQIRNSTTNSTHDITLTADPGNRHYGVAGDGVVIKLPAGAQAFNVYDAYVRLEWLEIEDLAAVGTRGIALRAPTASPNRLIIWNNIIHDVGTGGRPGIDFFDPSWTVDIWNNIFYNINQIGIDLDPGATVRVFNNTIYNCGGNGIDSPGSSPNITLRNNISVNNATDYAVPGLNGASSNNLASDLTGDDVSPGGGWINSVTATASSTTCPSGNCVGFSSITGSSENLHLISTTYTNKAFNTAADLNSLNLFGTDIDNGLRPSGANTWDIGADEYGPATAVALVSFSARGLDGAVELTWETASELNNLGFHLYRSQTREGPFDRMTETPIPGLGSSASGAKYRYVDSAVVNGGTYFYKLEDIESTGRTKLHGPVSATPVAGNGSVGKTPPSSSGITFGSPDTTSFRIVERSASHLLVELRTAGFRANPAGDGSVGLEIPGFVNESTPGAPALPAFRSWLDTVAGRSSRVVAVHETDVQTFSSLRPTAVGAPELISSTRGTVRAGERRTVRGPAFSDPGLYPDVAARIASEGYQGAAKKALLEISPLRWNRDRNELVLARRIRVHISLTGRELGHREKPAHARVTTLRRFFTSAPGLYAVRFEDVSRARSMVVDVRTLSLSRGGEPVAFHVEPDASRFGPGSTLYFVSAGASLNPYGREAVYELERQPGLTMDVVPASPAGTRIPYYWKTLSREENRYYQAGLLDRTDLWLWDLLFAPVTKRYPLELDAVAPALAPAQIDIWLQGVSDVEDSSDHHVRVYVNGTFLTEATWDGKTAQKLSAEVPPGVLHEGANELALENVGDTGAAYSMVMLDRYALSYPRQIQASGGTLEGRFEQRGTAQVRDITEDALVLDVTADAPRWLTGVERSFDAVRFGVDQDHRYLVVAPSAVLRSRVENRPASRLTSSLLSADYIVVGPQSLLPAAQPLLELRRRQGLTTRAVAIEQVFSEFGFGEERPQALKDFLSFAFHHWRRPAPRYVLLLGDATYDFKDYLGTGVRNQVPPYLVKTSYLWTASDAAYASVNGDDLLPDVAIGRLPAANEAEARVMVAKIVAYETTGRISAGAVTLVADNADAAGDFEAHAEELAQGILAGRHPETISLSRLGPDAARSAIRDALDRGTSLLAYMGHGGIHLWASENIFDTHEVDALETQSQQPLALTLNCLNGYFHFPYFNALGEALLKAEGKGAVAAFSPSGLSLDGPAHVLHKALLAELLSGRHRRLGDAVLAAQSVYASSGDFPELLQIYHLLGDPALTLR